MDIKICIKISFKKYIGGKKLKKIRWHVSSTLAIIIRIIMFRDRGKDWKHIPLDEFFYEQFFFFLTKILYTVQSVSSKKTSKFSNDTPKNF